MVLNETFAYPKKLITLDWKFPNGLWTTRFNNYDKLLVIFYKSMEYGNENEHNKIRVYANDVLVTPCRIEKISSEHIPYHDEQYFRDISAEKQFAFVYDNAYGKIRVEVDNEIAKKSICIVTLNNQQEEEESSSSSSSSIEEDYVIIGDKKYGTIINDSKMWITYNLDLKWDGLVIGSGDDTDIEVDYPKAWYYNNDEELYGFGVNGRKCGLLYNGYAIKYIEDHSSELLPSGWRVPYRNDLETITSLRPLTAIRSETVTWESNWGGTNESGFSMLPSGSIKNNSFTNIDSLGQLFGRLGCLNGVEYYSIDITNGPRVSGYAIKNIKEVSSIRLCKDLLL